VNKSLSQNKRSLRTQISLTIIVVLLITVLLIGFLSNTLINRRFEAYIIRQNQIRTEDIINSLSQRHDPFSGDWDVEYIHAIGMYALYDGYIIKLYDNDGAMIWDAENHDMALCSHIMGEISARMKKWNPDGNGDFTEHTYVIAQGGRETGRAVISYFGPYVLSENDFAFLSALNAALISAGLVSLLFALLTSGLLARRIARPVTKAAEIAKRVAGGNYAIQFEEAPSKTKELDDLTEAINHLAAALHEQEGLRKRLTADVAHELRTPLAAVGSHLEAMIEGVWEATPARLQSCYEEISRLSVLVSDLERLAKVESENLKPELTRIDLLEVVRAVGGSFEKEASDKKLRLGIEGEPCLLTADRARVSQIIANLLANAIKFTPENGAVRLSVRDAGRNAVLTVADDGIGIPEDEQPFIFERFYRADKSRNRKTGGAGIGLAIVKSIALAHGGTAEVESRPDLGSVFTVTLPKSGPRSAPAAD
jgi:signal transduction histidine kinase